jgi:hypothetical protein
MNINTKIVKKRIFFSFLYSIQKLFIGIRSDHEYYITDIFPSFTINSLKKKISQLFFHNFFENIS